MMTRDTDVNRLNDEPIDFFSLINNNHVIIIYYKGWICPIANRL